VFEGRRGDWRAAFMAMFHTTMQGTPPSAAHGADGFITDDTKWEEARNSIRDTAQGAGREASRREDGGRCGTARWKRGFQDGKSSAPKCWKMRETLNVIVDDALAYSVVNTPRHPPSHLCEKYGKFSRPRMDDDLFIKPA
jgi:hypothetical protein